MSTIQAFLQRLQNEPESIRFEDCIELIDRHYRFVETGFQNGEVINAPGQNNGSCKILAFAHLHGLSEEHALQCFGDYYRRDVLQNPHGEDHQNIRNFIRYGWSGVRFEGEPLSTP